MKVSSKKICGMNTVTINSVSYDNLISVGFPYKQTGWVDYDDQEIGTVYDSGNALGHYLVCMILDKTSSHYFTRCVS